MTMTGSDFYSGTALSGAGGGAASGALIGNEIVPGWGAAIGGLVGGGLGLFGGAAANSQRNNATAQQAKSLDQIMANMRAMSASNYDNHIQQLQKAINFYGPAQQYWDRLYGTGEAQPAGQGSWAGTNVTGGK
jgi:hypothetical protein